MPQRSVVDNEGIRARPAPASPVTGEPGAIVYQDLRDALFGVAGTWSIRRSARGDLMWLDPQPIAEDLPLLYQSYPTHGATAQQAVAAHRGREWRRRCILAVRCGYEPSSPWQRILGRILGLSPAWLEDARQCVQWIDGPAGKLLDVGCGNGTFLATMRQRGWSTTGVEFDPVSATRARESGSRVFEGSLQDAGFGEHSFDVVTMVHVIEHLPDPRQILAECFRILRPGGRLQLITPNIHALGHQEFGRSWRGLEIPRHLLLFSLPGLASLCTETGFCSLVETTLGRMARPMWLASHAIACDSGEPQPCAEPRTRARDFQRREQSALPDTDCGEEILVLTRKPG